MQIDEILSGPGQVRLVSSGEIEGLKLGIQKYWRQDRVTNLPNYEEVVITIAISLDQSGNIVSGPTLKSPASLPDNRFKVAYDVAAIAVRRAAPFDLPAEKYGRWKNIEITFNPQKGVFF